MFFSITISILIYFKNLYNSSPLQFWGTFIPLLIFLIGVIYAIGQLLGRWLLFKFRPSISFDFILDNTICTIEQDEYLLCELLIQNKLDIGNDVTYPFATLLHPKEQWDIKIARIQVSHSNNKTSFEEHPTYEMNRPLAEFLPFCLELEPKKAYRKYIYLQLINLPASIPLVKLEISIEDFSQRRYKKRIEFQRQHDKLLPIQTHFSRKGLF